MKHTKSILKQKKLKNLIQTTQPGQVLLSSYLFREGYTSGDLQKYRKGGWLASLGKGAMVRTGKEPLLSAAIHALQQERGDWFFHLGAESALYWQGFGQYLSWDPIPFQLMVPPTWDPPQWLLDCDWDRSLHWYRYAFLPKGYAVKSTEIEGYALSIARPERAIIECLRLVPSYLSPQEAAELMDNLPGLVPGILQQLLESSTSVKVNRLFLYLAERAGHAWFKHLQPQQINQGKGVRALVKGGKYVRKYNLMVPENIYTDV